VTRCRAFATPAKLWKLDAEVILFFRWSPKILEHLRFNHIFFGFSTLNAKETDPFFNDKKCGGRLFPTEQNS